MGRKVLFGALAVVASVVLPGCSRAPRTTPKVETEVKKEPPKAPEPVAALAAYYEMYKPARTWAADVLTLTLKSGEVPNVKNAEGKAGAWTAVFVSPSRREARTITYAVVDNGAGLRKGVNISDKQTWNGDTPASRAFLNVQFAIDSDDAYKTAAQKAAGWLRSHPGAKVTFTLGYTSRFPSPVWYIMWGTSKNGYAVYVNATSGNLITR